MQTSPLATTVDGSIPKRESTAATTGAQSDIRRTLDMLRQLFPKAATGNVSFQLWDGRLWPDEKARAATIELRHRDAIRAILLARTTSAESRLVASKEGA